MDGTTVGEGGTGDGDIPGDGSAEDTGPGEDAGPDDGGTDAGPPEPGATCEPCETSDDCRTGSFCASLSVGGRACLPGCNPDLADCPRGFNCVLDVTSGIDATICVPSGGPCCVDQDADGYGQGIGCDGSDCDDEQETVNPGMTELCDGIDNDCDEEADEPPTDCTSGRCAAKGDGTYESVEGADCVDALCEDGTLSDCGLYTCDEGGEEGIVCATSCADDTGADDDGLCIEAAHCDDGSCEMDQPNGGVCDEDGDCASAHCENGFCCDTGTCCSVAEDCPGAGGFGTTCDDPTTCQGTTGMLTCESSQCTTMDGIPDDSACTTETEAKDCGFFQPVYCTGETEQTEPSCPTTCVDDGDCVEAAHCTSGICIADRDPGQPCVRDGECTAGLFCVDGVCCTSACDGVCEACNLTSDGTCSPNTAGTDPANDCPGISCTGYYDGFDGRGRCYGKRDVTESRAVCDGAGACLDEATLCGNEGAGSVVLTCDEVCQEPVTGTCIDMTAPSCTDLDDPTDLVTCGIGACERTVQRCIGGAEQTCTPGTPEVETCNDIDDDCDGTVDDGTSSGLCPPGTHVDLTACVGGTCEIDSCDPGWGNCDGDDSNGCETSLTTLTDCGSCGTTCNVDNAADDCSTGTCRIDTCNPGYDDCDGDDSNGCETSLTSLPDCGSCGSECDLANASESCATGVCQLADCDSGFADCDGTAGTGCETPLNTLSNCGACGVACSLAHASESCSSGSCSLTACDSGWANCDGDPSNGCETPTNTLSDCGGCGITCDITNASESCSTGTCTFGSCESGWGNCDGNNANGCETSLETLDDCGSCGTSCNLSNASESCSTGSCTLSSCDTNWGDCDGDSTNGCETSLTSLTDCGSCDTTCNISGSGESCATGTCEPTSCDPGQGDCDGDSSNGCETSLETLSNCGGCGVPCDLAHASESCATGSCVLGSCDPGWEDCDGDPSNGCETSLLTLGNCGGCGNVCDLTNASESCSTGTCVLVSCDASWGNCDGSTGNGCETSLSTLSDCGSCGTSCSLAHASESCSTGTCTLQSCDSGWEDCDSSSGNGCETSTTTLSNCGGCGVTCDLAHASESCSTGSCSLSSCDSGWGDCNSTAGDGCETSLTTLSNCGSCGSPCSLANASETCATGTCQVSSCSAGYYDVDGAASNGCECEDTGGGGSCGASDLGDVATGESFYGPLGSIPQSGTSDWFRVDFPPQTSSYGGGVPSIELSRNDGDIFRLDILFTCGGSGASCGDEGGTASAVTQYSYRDNVSSGLTGFSTRNDGWPSTVYIRVFRTSSGPSCAKYRLLISR